MRRKILILGLGGLLVCSGSLWAQERQGDQLQPLPDEANTRVATRAANFLSIGVGARAQALGGAGTVMSDGVHALYWNTASISRIEGFSAGMSYTPLYGNSGIDHLFIGTTLPFLNGALGLSLISLTSGDIPRTSERIVSGTNPVLGPTFEWRSTAIGVHYAAMITDRMALGGAIKFISEGIDGAKADWVGGDLSVHFVTGLWGTTLAASLLNVGSESNFEGDLVEVNISAADEIFPTQEDVRVGASTRALQLPTVFHFAVKTDLTGTPDALFGTDPRHRFTAVGELADAIDDAIQPSFGFEYSYNNFVFARAGKRWFNHDRAGWETSDGLSFGGGVRVPVAGRHLAFDYAYTGFGLLDNVQVFSFEYGF